MGRSTLKIDRYCFLVMFRVSILFFRVVSGDYGKPWVFIYRKKHISSSKKNFRVLGRIKVMSQMITFHPRRIPRCETRSECWFTWDWDWLDWLKRMNWGLLFIKKIQPYPTNLESTKPDPKLDQKQRFYFVFEAGVEGVLLQNLTLFFPQLIMLQSVNGCIWKVITSGDTPIFRWTMIRATEF